MDDQAVPRIFMSSPDVGERESAALMRAFEGGWIAPLGPEVDAFEAELAERCGRRFGVALSSGTAALHLALLDAGAAAGTAVIVPTMTFAATANAVMYTGAEPVFVDCDPATGNLDPALMREALIELQRDGIRVSAVIPVDLLGRCADFAQILPIAEQFGVTVIEDAAEALGASTGGRAAGSFGRSAALSFNGNKVITTSGGGAIVTDDAALAERARYLSTQARQPAVHYEHTEVGYNYRLSNLLAALGRAQLGRLDEMIAGRRANRDRYTDLFDGVDGVAVFQRGGDEHDNCWLTAILVDEDVTGWSPRELSDHLGAANIESRPLWKPMHLQPVFDGSRSFTNGSSENLFRAGLTLPSGSALSQFESERVTTEVVAFMDQRATR